MFGFKFQWGNILTCMADYKLKKFKHKFDQEIQIRSALVQDARAILELSQSVIAEEIYQLTSSSEFKMTLEAEEKWIQNHLSDPNRIILIAEVNSQIVGMLDFANGHRKRIAHTGQFGMSIASPFRNQGVGSILLQALFEWAKENQFIEKICLSVHSDNQAAIALYKKMGFEIEGVRKKDLKYDNGRYVDTVLMGRFVD
jgi:RimJ/RimL family protein N-acetyltransferase